MEGILFVTDHENKKKYVQIDLEKYGEYVEDWFDGLKASLRKDEPSVSLEMAIKELKEEGIIDEDL